MSKNQNNEADKMKRRINQIRKIYSYKYTRLITILSLFLTSPTFLPTKIALFIFYLLPIYLVYRQLFIMKTIIINNIFYLVNSFVPSIIYMITLFISLQIDNLIIKIASCLTIIYIFYFIIDFILKFHDEYYNKTKNKIFIEAYLAVLSTVYVYMLIGVMWFHIYMIIAAFDSNAFSVYKVIEKPFDLLYFSFKTLTTVGYGDISPNSIVARMFTSSEAIIGVMFPVVVISQSVEYLRIK